MFPAERQIFDRRWLILVLITYVVEIAFFAIVSLTPLSASQSNSILNGTSGALNQIQSEPFPFKVISIFLNNAGIMVLEFVPILGWIRFASVTLATGQVLSALGSTSGVPAAFLLIVTFLSPHSWIELSSYAVAVAESFLLLYAIPARRLRAEVSRAAMSFGLAMLLLIFAAFLESITLEFGLDGFAYAWVLAILIGLGLYLVWRSQRRPPAPPYGAEPAPPPPIEVPPQQPPEPGAGGPGSSYME